ncbi:CelD/BcsL family acetyltransferase involved in cellulose biosynthesis [Methylorubrum rhodinum]|uniref:CelD/BcsL family acetyltransferase involved in cellulose biosynthesis n=1 Tax=Methylorubrum rhodinum TaxID=29428 RepID=A0A840ZT12_9HYPH|nr:GNAT family N-acetyltransferase [Methylorubrum rhodinum]MBB5760254.1 CelD/BcsL family acetyltransferase involved in cellulose biosynthesis [Methylorubrum rhodinum]
MHHGAAQGPTIRVHASLRDAEADLETPGLAGYAFGRHAWLRAWHDTLGVGVAPAIVVVADVRVRMVIPLGIRRSRGLRVLEFLGGSVTDYNAPLADPAFAGNLDAASVRTLWTRIAAVLPPHDTVRLLRMPASLDPPEGAGTGRVPNPLVHLPGAMAAGVARSVALPDSYAALVGSMRSQFVGDTRRRWRRLAEVGSSDFAVAADAAAMRDLLVGLKRMKSRRWLETGDRDWFADPAFAGFYDAMGRMTLPEGRIHGCALSVAGTVVAAHLGLVYRGRFYVLLLGWESGDWQRFSTGRLMIDAMMKAAIDEDHQVFDFTVGDEAYKREWADTELPLFRCEGAVTMRGRLALASISMREDIRARAKRVTWLRRAIRRLAGRPPLPGTG